MQQGKLEMDNVSPKWEWRIGVEGIDCTSFFVLLRKWENEFFSPPISHLMQNFQYSVSSMQPIGSAIKHIPKPVTEPGGVAFAERMSLAVMHMK
ncbi:uncharacterized protein Bfra_010355 [Botrytis fragariae]|uniref:Uncharacterized protein n=1 Tax=Botrytis fragariae TaxID=1964551 RepID=A0A8H6EF93_9HELO|nr:uncharacterized protein Bfra_010355 [Botrytis fragariae]KAF5870209.1 hypothetical protein Bfra_010355 [Botrytis fragariae]